MFTGIIEEKGAIINILEDGSNLDFTIETEMTSELKIDQSVAHNGVCLTIVAIDNKQYVVTAVEETLQKTSLGVLKIGDHVNLERCMAMNGRLDGHMVYGHVDQIGKCIGIRKKDGSTIFSFEYENKGNNVLVEKGSITLNGISLTVFDVKENQFSIAIIPYTLEHTNLKTLKVGNTVNLEFDILGKYIHKILSSQNLL